MSGLIKRQDAINAVAQLYRYESDRMTALQEVPIVSSDMDTDKAMAILHNSGIGFRYDCMNEPEYTIRQADLPKLFKAVIENIGD